MWIALSALGLLIVVALVAGTIVTAQFVSHFAFAEGEPPKDVSVPTDTPSTSPSPQGLFSADQMRFGYLTADQLSKWGTYLDPAFRVSSVDKGLTEMHEASVDSAAPPLNPSCAFATTIFPVTGSEISPAVDEPTSEEVNMATLGTSSTVSQSMRVFTSNDEASEYLKATDENVAGCASYETADWSATMSRRGVGTTLAHSLWQETGTGRYAGDVVYVVDIRRDNLVSRVRIAITSEDAARFDSFTVQRIVDDAEATLIALKPAL